MSPKTIILMGRSGSGKGTQSALLEVNLEARDGREVFYFEAGSKFREFVAQGSYSSILAEKIMSQGLLLPSFFPVWNWANNFINNLTGEEHIIVDGGLRLINEAIMFEEALHFYQRQNVIFIYLNVTSEEAEKRLTLRGRHDDTSPEKIKNRMGWFEKDVIPVIEYFKTRPNVKFIEIDGNPPIEIVTESIMKSLEPYLND